MIPLRVSMRNFLCYRDPVELSFDGEPLWVLSGPNGVGKSAVVDAMTYALFGKYRGSEPQGANPAANLIHHGSKGLRVEFDFAYAGRRYRVWRTRSLSGGTAQGVADLDAEGGAAPVPDVNKAGELTDWVERTLGLSFAAFTSAVLLRQGEAERLIDADRSERLKVLHGIIDFERYLDLHRVVADETTGLNRDRTRLAAALAEKPEVPAVEVAAARSDLEAARSTFEAARALESGARDRLGPAHRWEELEASRRAVQSELDEAAARAAGSEAIERQAARLAELRALVPLLEAEAAARRDREAAGAEGERLEAARRAAERARDERAAALDAARRAWVEARDRAAATEARRAQLEAQRRELSDRVEQAERVASLWAKLDGLNKALAAFPPDLDERLAAARAATDEARLAREAAPHLAALVRHRGAARAADADIVRVEAERVESVARLVRAEESLRAATEARGRADDRLREADQASAAAAARRADAIARRDRFHALGDAAECATCGQPVPPSHRERERRRLDEAAAGAEAEAARADEERRAATAARVEAGRRQEEVRREREDAASISLSMGHERDVALHRAGAARSEFDRARDALSAPLRDRVAPIDADGFPTRDDAAAAEALGRDERARTKALAALEAQAQARDRASQEVASHARAAEAVGRPDDVAGARSERDRIDAELATARDDGTRLAREQEATEAAGKAHAAALKAAQAELDQLSARAGAASATSEAAARALEAARATLPAGLKPPDDAGRRALAGERDRLAAAGVAEAFAQLAEDLALRAERERRLAAAAEKIAAMPEAQRRPVAQVEAEVAAAATAVAGAAQARDAAAACLDDLTRRDAEHRSLAAQLDQADHDHKIHVRLSGLLGEKGLQRDRVRDAEREILALAGGILRRVSGGELWFEPPPGDGDRAFDLIVRRRDCDGPILAANLSGGQRFRVAVALALAICRYAGGQARPLESIFIDEGFGVLDHAGRLAMIDELRTGQDLKRVILVSHQDDVAEAFPVGYRLRSEAGATVAEAFRRR